MRVKVNPIAFVAALCMLAAYCLFAFVKVAVVVSISGLTLAQYITPLYYIPLALGIIMLVVAFAGDEKATLIAGCVALVGTGLCALLSRQWILSSSMSMLTAISPQISLILGFVPEARALVGQFSALIPVTIGFGGIATIVCCAVYAASGFLFQSRRAQTIQEVGNPFETNEKGDWSSFD